MVPRIAVVVVVVVAGLAGGCGNPETSARNAFGQAHSCPTDRVQSFRARTDLRWSVVGWGGMTATPPDDVKADAARLAKWTKDKEAEYAPLVKLLDEHDVFEAHGCGHDSYVGCKRLAKKNGLGGDPFACSVVPMTTPKP